MFALWLESVWAVEGEFTFIIGYAFSFDVCPLVYFRLSFASKLSKQLFRFAKDMKFLLLDKVYVVNVLGIFSIHFICTNFVSITIHKMWNKMYVCMCLFSCLDMTIYFLSPTCFLLEREMNVYLFLQNYSSFHV